MAHGMTKAHMIEAFPRITKERDRLDLMLHDVMNGAVMFGSWVRESDGTSYRVGISRAESYPIAIHTFRCKGQSDSIQVFDLEPWEADVRRMRASSECWEPILQAINSAKDAVRTQARAAA